MKSYTAVIERDPETGLFVGYVPGFPGAHSQAETMDELNETSARLFPCCWKTANPAWKLNS